MGAVVSVASGNRSLHQEFPVTCREVSHTGSPLPPQEAGEGSLLRSMALESSHRTLDRIFEPVAPGLEGVEKLLEKWVLEAPPGVAHPMRHTLFAGGKRLRPGVVLLTAGLGDGRQSLEFSHALAGVAEIIHTASLIHDDVIDESHLRRGAPSVPHQWSSKFALLVGDFWYSWSMNCFVEMTKRWPAALDVLGEVATTVCRMSEAETETLSRQEDLIDEQQYLQLAAGKTGSLMATCCKLGTFCWDAHPLIRTGIWEYGQHLGISFQIADDILDIRGDEGCTGEPALLDFRRDGLSLPLILLRKRSGEDVRRLLDRLQGSEALSEDLLHQARIVCEESGAMAEAFRMAEQESDLAREALKGCPEGPHLDSLKALCSYAIDRAK